MFLLYNLELELESGTGPVPSGRHKNAQKISGGLDFIFNSNSIELELELTYIVET